jgi:hypothetical protein
LFFFWWFSGEIEIGMITFYMSINVTYKTLKPHLPEIAKYIAQELDIDFHQVKAFSWVSFLTGGNVLGS